MGHRQARAARRLEAQLQRQLDADGTTDRLHAAQGWLAAPGNQEALVQQFLGMDVTDPAVQQQLRQAILDAMAAAGLQLAGVDLQLHFQAAPPPPPAAPARGPWWMPPPPAPPQPADPPPALGPAPGADGTMRLQVVPSQQALAHARAQLARRG